MNALYAEFKAKFFGCVDSCLDHLTNFERRRFVRGAVFIAVFCLIAATVYLLNVHTPLNVDDFDFMYSWATGDFVSGFADVIRSQMVFYRTWGGRSVNHANLQWMLYLGKDVFNVANTAMYLLLLLEIYYLARPGRKGEGLDWLILLASHLILFSMVPFFGVVCLWTTGACNYLWGTVLALMPLLLMRSVRDGGWFSKNRLLGALCVPAGLIAGWTNENTACGVIAVVFVALAVDALEGKKVHIRLWAMWAAQCIGALLMLLAPGNAARASTSEAGSALAALLGSDSIFVELVGRFLSVTAYGASYLGVLFTAALLISALLKGKGARIGYAFLMLFGALTASYAMVGSPELSDRTFTSSYVLVITALMVLLSDLLARTPSAGAAKMIVLPALLMVTAYTGYHAIKDVKAYEAEWYAVVDVIETAVANGEEEVIVPSLRSHSRFTVDTQISADPALWPNTTMEKYFGIRIIGE